jgi:G3E family GTPase
MTPPVDRIPVTLLTGFLGSGKTTRLNAILRDPRFADAAVVVNELGDIGLDHLLVAKAGDNIILLNSGCLCCAVLDTFKETVADLYARRARGEVPAFSRVFVETTGLADPAPILQSLLRDPIVAHLFRLDRVITTVDAELGLQTLTRHREAVKQIAVSDVVVVTKTDRTGGRAPEALLSAISGLNATAQVVSGGPTDISALDLHLRNRVDVGEGGHAHHHDGDIVAHSFVLDHAVSWAGLAGWTDLVRETFGDALLRCKGLIEIAETGKPVLVQGVQRVFAPPERLAEWPNADHRSRLVCIVQGIDTSALEASLAALKAEPGTFRPASLKELMTASR